MVVYTIKPRVFFQTDSVVIGLETTSEASFGKLSSTITRGYPAVEVVKQDITKGNTVP